LTKLVLILIDSLKSEMLGRAIDEGKAPMLAEIVRRGTRVRECVSVFPSVTPAASASITTGVPVDSHGVPSINWYHRGEQRYVEYGSSWPATRTFGVLRTLNDIVYNMNFEHLSRAHPTFFELLDDAGVRTACTPFLIFRGRTRHELALQGWMRRVAHVANFHHAVYGPAELFYGELYSSREVDCRPTLARPGTRDAYSGCVGAHLAQYDLYDYMLFSLPDNDHYSHRNGPDATVTSISWADHNLAQLVDASGGTDEFLARHAVILMADHSQTSISRALRLADALSEWSVLRPNDPRPDLAELAVCPGGRSAMVYALGDEQRRAELVPAIARRVQSIEGVDIAAWRENDAAHVWSRRGELRFTRGTAVSDRRGGSWDLEGSLSTLEATVSENELLTPRYPDALGRIWAALASDSTGEVLLSAEPRYEFVDWGGADHVGGGSHGSLARGDSDVPLVFLNCGPDLGSDRGRDPEDEWSIADVAKVVLEHFGERGPRAGAVAT
jgi:predicted AlkP superfamily pyrophosphatase or phosphodiesterase